jgi:hypothetical protein
LAGRPSHVFIVVLVLAGGAPGRAFGQRADAAELAAGDKAARGKDWDAALTHYQAALQASAGPRALLGVADALLQLGRAGEAYEAYDDAQRTYGSKLAATEKTLVAARLKELTAKTGWLSVRVSEPGAEVDLDGKVLGTSPVPALVRVAVGTHEVRVTEAGFVPFAGRAEVAPDGKAVVEATMVREAAKGHVVVQASGGQELRVIVDGVDVGPSPWEGDLPPGPHEISGRSSGAVAAAQHVDVTAGSRLSVQLVSSAIAAHIQVRTSDGKGIIYVDGVVKGEGAFEADVAPGSHGVVVAREGYERFEKLLTLGERQTWAETVTLKSALAAGGPAQAAERGFEGIYGGFGLAGLFGIGGQGTELDTNCDTLGAASCKTPSPIGGGAFGYVGWTWNPVGFELMLGASADTVQQTAHFDGAGKSGTLPLAMPARDEQFTFARFGGLVAVRARASIQGPLVRGTIAGGIGFSYKQMVMERDATATDGTNRQDKYVPEPKSVAYVSPGITLEGALHVRFTPTLALAVGASLWADNASIAGSNSVPPNPGRLLAAPNNPPGAPPPVPIPTPQYHLATGAQVFLGPFLGMQFGP